MNFKITGIIRYTDNIKYELSNCNLSEAQLESILKNLDKIQTTFNSNETKLKNEIKRLNKNLDQIKIRRISKSIRER